MSISNASLRKPPADQSSESSDRSLPSVLMIVPKFPPIGHIGSFRSLKFAVHLPEYGWQPLVLTTQSMEQYDSSALRRIPADLHVERIPIPGERPSTRESSTAVAPAASHAIHEESAARSIKDRIRNTSPYRWARNAWQAFIQTPDKHISWNRDAFQAAARMIRAHQPAAIFTSGPPHSVHLIGRRLKQVHGIPWVADFRDPWARRPWGAKNQNPWGQRLDPWLEKSCVSAADAVILNTPGMRDDFAGHYKDMPNEKFVAIPNSCDPELAEVVEGLLKQQPTRQPDQTVRICHPGSLYRARDPRPLLQGLKLLQSEGITVHFEQIGSCDSEFELDRFVADNELADLVTIRAAVPHDQILKDMAAADILVLLQPDTPIQVPGKLFEMILFGKPILALCHDGNTADMVRDYKLGPVADPRSPHEIASAIRGLVSRMSQPRDIHEGPDYSGVSSAFDARRLTSELARHLQKVSLPRS